MRRNIQREKYEYFIVRKLHKSSAGSELTEACVNFGNMVIRGDRAKEKTTPMDDDKGVAEVV